jgi:hypothetical protein
MRGTTEEGSRAKLERGEGGERAGGAIKREAAERRCVGDSKNVTRSTLSFFW